MISRHTLQLLALCVYIIQTSSAFPQTAIPPASSVPYELKGDQLGMTLVDFKAKYHHVSAGDSRPGPFCSDDYPDASMQGIDPTERRAGIVACRIYFPFEERRGSKNTIANVPVSDQMFRFIDGNLFRIDIVFDDKSFDTVRSAFEDKYGPPYASETKNYQNGFGADFEGKNILWQNGCIGQPGMTLLGDVLKDGVCNATSSMILMVQFHGDLTRSFILFMHIALEKEAKARSPKLGPDL